jgi:hypothetical protein
MDYDSYILETPEEEDERINGCAPRERARQEYLADNCDYLTEREREEKIDRNS